MGGGHPPHHGVAEVGDGPQQALDAIRLGREPLPGLGVRVTQGQVDDPDHPGTAVPQDLAEASLDLPDGGEDLGGVGALQHVAQPGVELPGGQVGPGHPVREDAHLLIGRDGLLGREGLAPPALVLGGRPGMEEDQALELVGAQRQVAAYRQRQPPERRVCHLREGLRLREGRSNALPDLGEHRRVLAGHDDSQALAHQPGRDGGEPVGRLLTRREHHPIVASLPIVATISHVIPLRSAIKILDPMLGRGRRLGGPVARAQGKDQAAEALLSSARRRRRPRAGSGTREDQCSQPARCSGRTS